MGSDEYSRGRTLHDDFVNAWVGNETSVWEQMLIYLHYVIAF